MVAVSVDIVEASNILEFQNIYLSSEITKKLKVKVSDFIKLQLPSGSSYIAKPHPLCETDVDGIFLATCTSCVSVNPRIEDRRSVQIDSENISVLEIVPISRLRLNVYMTSVDGIINYSQNKKEFLNKLENLLSGIGVVNNSSINFQAHEEAKTLGIKKIDIINLSLCGISDDQIESFVGKGFLNLNSIRESCDEGKYHKSFREGENLIKVDDIFCNENDHDVSHISVFKSMETSLDIISLKLSSNIQHPILLTGPIGCGKTTLITKAAALHHNYLVCLDCKNLDSRQFSVKLEKFVNEKYNNAFNLSKHRNCIFLIQHIETIFTNFNGYFNSVQNFMRNRIFKCIENGILVLLTTSYPQQLPVEFSNECEHISYGNSTLIYRRELLDSLCSDFLPPKDRQKLAIVTPGFVAADLLHIVQHVRSLPISNGSSAKNELFKLSRQHESALLKSLKLIGERPVAVPLAGMDELKNELTDILEDVILEYYKQNNMNITMPKGVLLYGPPGCGKTQLMCSLAENLGCTFFVIQPKHIISQYVGETEKNLVQIFQSAKRAKPAVLFFDEIDGLFGDRRSAQTSGVRLNMLTEMLQLLDGASEEDEMSQILVCGATNNPHKLDPALLRPGRFDKVFYVPPPCEEQRLQILQLKTKNVLLEDDCVLTDIARDTELFTGADLGNIVRTVCVFFRNQ